MALKDTITWVHDYLFLSTFWFLFALRQSITMYIWLASNSRVTPSHVRAGMFGHGSPVHGFLCILYVSLQATVSFCLVIMAWYCL